MLSGKLAANQFDATNSANMLIILLGPHIERDVLISCFRQSRIIPLIQSSPCKSPQRSWNLSARWAGLSGSGLPVRAG